MNKHFDPLKKDWYTFHLCLLYLCVWSILNLLWLRRTQPELHLLKWRDDILKSPVQESGSQKTHSYDSVSYQCVITTKSTWKCHVCIVYPLNAIICIKSVGLWLECEIIAGETSICQLVRNACAHCKYKFTVCARLWSRTAAI